MKYRVPVVEPLGVGSHPARGAWIEIFRLYGEVRERGASHPARGAWIEISPFFRGLAAPAVAPRKGCVD